MQNILKQGKIESDDWLLLRPNDDASLPSVAASQDVIVPWRSWLADYAFWSDRSSRCAVWLAPDDDPADLVPYLGKFALIAVDFPSFTDGRGYSIARLLRERHSYRQELRALGDVGQDQLRPLWLVGFDSFEISQGRPSGACVGAQEAISDYYQCNYRQPQPLFRRSITSA
jgi:uncharacterized protein (DUF934 family)